MSTIMDLANCEIISYRVNNSIALPFVIETFEEAFQGTAPKVYWFIAIKKGTIPHPNSVECWKKIKLFKACRIEETASIMLQWKTSLGTLKLN